MAAGDLPGPAQAPAGSWVLVLESYPKDRYSPDQARELAAALPGRTTVVDSSQTAGMRSGFWAVVSEAAFPAEADARAACGEFGRKASGACYPRRVG